MTSWGEPGPKGGYKPTATAYEALGIQQMDEPATVPLQHEGEPVDEARAFAAGIDRDIPQIALQASVEAQVETASKPYTAAAFFHFKATGSLKRHRTYHAVYESEAFAVDFEADYESGDLTITVEEVTTSERDDG